MINRYNNHVCETRDFPRSTMYHRKPALRFKVIGRGGLRRPRILPCFLLSPILDRTHAHTHTHTLSKHKRVLTNVHILKHWTTHTCAPKTHFLFRPTPSRIDSPAGSVVTSTTGLGRPGGYRPYNAVITITIVNIYIYV